MRYIVNPPRVGGCSERSNGRQVSSLRNIRGRAIKNYGTHTIIPLLVWQAGLTALKMIQKIYDSVILVVSPLFEIERSNAVQD